MEAVEDEETEPLHFDDPDPVDYLDIHFCCRERSQVTENLKTQIEDIEAENVFLRNES